MAMACIPAPSGKFHEVAERCPPRSPGKDAALRWAVAATIATASVTTTGIARAQSIIKHPGEHPDYPVEIEPHVLLGPFDPPGPPDGTGLGAGLRLTIPVVKNGFVDTINNSVGIGFGLDWMHYEGSDASVGPCARWIPGLNGTTICTEVGAPYGGPSNYFYFPGVMQWNFWLTPRFSVFGEPGLSLYYEKGKFQSNGHLGVTPTLAIGGRFHFSERVALTVRLGYPAFALGLSFFP